MRLYCLLMSNRPENIQRAEDAESLAWHPLPAHTPTLPVMSLAAKPFDETDDSERPGVTSTLHPGDSSTSTLESHGQGKFMIARKKQKMEMPICTRVSLPTFRALEVWCDNSFRKRSEVIGLVLERIVEILSQQHCIEQPVEEFVRRLRVGPKL